MEIRILLPADDRRAFASGNPDLDRFFHAYAGQNQFRHHLGTTYIAVEGGQILGYVTIAAGGINIEDLPIAERRKLPDYPLPVLRLARLAVGHQAQGVGIGSQLLRYVLLVALRMADEIGCVGVLVDAKQDAVAFYERLGFKQVELLEGESNARPIPISMFLPMRAIRAADQPPK